MNSSSCAMLLYTFLFTARSMGVVSDHDVRGNATLVVGKKHGLVQSSVRADSVTAESYKWLLCDSPDANARSVTIGRDVPPGTHDADNQLCAATYIELYRLTGQSNQTVVPVVLPSPKRTVLAASIYHSVHTNHLVYHMEQTDDRRDDGGIRQRDQ
eukprot:m.560641 g.560641  ORF g.560641 m.560641 type:complete len:156 (+) comp22212_c2_seq1:575-1042(+)